MSTTSIKRQASLSAFLTPQPKTKKIKLGQTQASSFSSSSSSPLKASTRARIGDGDGAGIYTKPIVIDESDDEVQSSTTPLDKGKGKAKAESPQNISGRSSTIPKNIHPLFGSNAMSKPVSSVETSSKQQISSTADTDANAKEQDPYSKLDLSTPWPPPNHPYHPPPNPTFNHPIVLPPLPSGLKEMKYNTKARIIKDENTDLDLVYFKRFIDPTSSYSPSSSVAPSIPNTMASAKTSSGSSSGTNLLTETISLPSSKELMKYLLEELPWYRVKYTVRGININTPRYTTVFGKDSTDIPWTGYQKCKPRAIPEVLLNLMRKVEQVTSAQFNFCLVNYYSTGDDSISYHQDSESFLGPNPTIASLSLGASRDFFLRHVDHKHHHRTGKPVDIQKFELGDGDMVVMQGRTQHEWMHSIPKRKNVKGRINITFRKGVVRYATENYNNYNVGKGPMFRWNKDKGVMVEVES
ncbi:hypothetical protein IAT40_007034 [Kwoniella sp. CBS 6097]